MSDPVIYPEVTAPVIRPILGEEGDPGATGPPGGAMTGAEIVAAIGAGVYDSSGAATTAVSDHVAALDPHALYALESALGTAAYTAATAYATAAQGATADAALPRTAGGASVTNLGSVTSNCETANVATTKTVDLSTYNAVDYTMTGPTTFTFSNWATSGKMGMFSMILRGAYTPTFPAAVKWSSGSAPTYTTPALYVFTSVDAGTSILGAQVGRAFA